MRSKSEKRIFCYLFQFLLKGLKQNSLNQKVKVRFFCQKQKFIIITAPLQLNHSALSKQIAIKLIFLPEATKQRARVRLKTLMSTFATIIFWTNRILATKTKKPTINAKIIPSITRISLMLFRI